MWPRTIGLTLSIALVAGCAALLGPGRHPTHDVRDLRIIARDPRSHVGEWRAFDGEVLTAEESKGVLVFQMIVGRRLYHPVDAGEVIVVVFPNSSAPVVKGDCVKAFGTVAGNLDGKNAFGGDVRLVTLSAVALSHTPECSASFGAGKDYWLKAHDAAYRYWAHGEKPGVAEAK